MRSDKGLNNGLAVSSVFFFRSFSEGVAVPCIPERFCSSSLFLYTYFILLSALFYSTASRHQVTPHPLPSYRGSRLRQIPLQHLNSASQVLSTWPNGLNSGRGLLHQCFNGPHFAPHIQNWHMLRRISGLAEVLIVLMRPQIMRSL